MTLNWRNELNKETTVWLKDSNATPWFSMNNEINNKEQSRN